VLAHLFGSSVRELALGALLVTARLALQELRQVLAELLLALEDRPARGEEPRVVTAEGRRALAVYLGVVGVELGLPHVSRRESVETQRRGGGSRELRVGRVVLR